MISRGLILLIVCGCICGCTSSALLESFAVSSVTSASNSSSEEELHNGTRPTDFPLDSSKFIVFVEEGTPAVDIYSVSANCYKCDLQLLAEGITAGDDYEIQTHVMCQYPVVLSVVLSGTLPDRATTPNKTFSCGDRGVYLITVQYTDKNESNSNEKVLTFTISDILPPWSGALPLIIWATCLLFIVVGVVITYRVYICYDRRRRRRMPPQFSPIADGDVVDSGIGGDDVNDDDLSEPSMSIRSSSSMSLRGGNSSNGNSATAPASPASNSSTMLRGSTQYTYVSGSRPGRVVSLDCFRGFTMAMMVFCNMGSGGYWFLEHSVWNGLAMADFILPWFIFVMGISQALSLRAHVRTPRLTQWKKVVFRSLALVGIGIYLNRPVDYRGFRVLGVLQRIGLTNLILTSIAIWMPKLRTPRTSDDIFMLSASRPRWQQVLLSMLADFFPYVLEFIVVALIGFTHVALMLWVPVPDCGSGYLGPGGIGDEGMFENCTGGFAGYVDRVIFGENYMFKYPTCQTMYQTTVLVDPEGLWGTLSSVVLGFIGLQCGRILFHFHGHGQRIVRWLIWGVFCGALALALCGARQDGGFLPINKNIWTLSYTFATCAVGCVMLIICYILVDVLGVWSGAPFTFVGMNSIAIYIMSCVLSSYPPFSMYTPSTHGGVLLRSTLSALVAILVAFLLYHMKVFIKLG